MKRITRRRLRRFLVDSWAETYSRKMEVCVRVADGERSTTSILFGRQCIGVLDSTKASWKCGR